MRNIVIRRVGHYCKLLVGSVSLVLAGLTTTVIAAEDQTAPKLPPTPEVLPMVVPSTIANKAPAKEVNPRKHLVLPDAGAEKIGAGENTPAATPKPKPTPKPEVDADDDTEDGLGNERPSTLKVGNEPLVVPPHSIGVRMAKAENPAVEAELAACFKDAKREYNLHHYERAILTLRAILEISPRHIPATELLRQVRAKITEADEKITAIASAQIDKEALLEVAEHSNRPPIRQAVVRPRLARRSDGEEHAKRAKMKDYLNERLTFDFMDADLEYVLEKLFQLTGANIIADPEAMKGKTISMHVSDLPLKSVLEYIVRNNTGISYSVTEDAIWITAADAKDLKKLMYVKIYPLMHGLVSTTASTGVSSGATGAGGAGRPAAAPAPAAPAAGGAEEPSYLQTLLKWIEDIKDAQTFPEGSKYHVDKQTNNLVIYTTPAGHQKIEDLLEAFDQPPIQVLIKTRFLDVSSNKDNAIGLNLDSLASHNPTTSTPNPHAGGPDIPAGKTQIGSLVSGATSFVPAGTPGGTILAITGLRTDPLFKATLNLLYSDRNTKVLSEPQVLAANNKEANINIGQKFYYIASFTPTALPPTVVNNTTITQNTLTPVFEEMDLGFILKVTPSVGRDLKTINLHLKPEIISLAEGQTISDFQNINIGDPNQPTNQQPAIKKPTTNQTSVETDVVVEDNSYVILGGLISNFSETQTRKIPGLSNIPGLGKLFQSKSNNVTKRNLMIIVEAQIITAGGRTYYKDPEPDDGDIREGGLPKAPGQTLDAHSVPPLVPLKKHSITPKRAPKAEPVDVQEETKEIPVEKPAEKKSSQRKKSVPVPAQAIANNEPNAEMVNLNEVSQTQSLKNAALPSAAKRAIPEEEGLNCKMDR